MPGLETGENFTRRPSVGAGFLTLNLPSTCRGRERIYLNRFWQDLAYDHRR